jgi:uncharacterized protein YqeY
MNIEASTTACDDAGNLRERLRGGLPVAMKARDVVAVAALRSALSAIDNAEAVEPAQAPPPDGDDTDVAKAVIGVRAADVERRALTGAEMEQIVRAEMADRDAAARHYEQLGRDDQAERLRGEAAVLGAYLGIEDAAGTVDES